MGPSDLYQIPKNNYTIISKMEVLGINKKSLNILNIFLYLKEITVQTFKQPNLRVNSWGGVFRSPPPPLGRRSIACLDFYRRRKSANWLGFT